MHDLLTNERQRQERGGLEMIASENFTPQQVLEAQGSLLTNKYAEGYPGDRYYAGCKHHDRIEQLGRDRAQDVFNTDHANLQPHSGSQANFAAYFSVLEQGDTVLGPELAHGGHLSHGHSVNFSGDLFDFHTYRIDEDTERFEPGHIIQRARDVQPDLIVCGFSAYPREIPFQAFREAADEADAYLMADIAHIAGLVAADEHPQPFPHCDIVTTTTHKTLRGARGGMVMCRDDLADQVDSAVFPYTQGGPLMHQVAGKTVALGLAQQQDFHSYQHQIRRNTETLAARLQEHGFRLVSGGTDNHLVLVDVDDSGLTGNEAEARLEEAGIIVNKNMIPYDERSPRVTSGIRIGTPALTTRGMGEQQFRRIADLIAQALKHGETDTVQDQVEELCRDHPIYDDAAIDF